MAGPTPQTLRPAQGDKPFIPLGILRLKTSPNAAGRANQGARLDAMFAPCRV